MVEHMKKHKAIIEPKFRLVTEALNKEIAPLGIGSWTDPEGGYFISFNALNGCAKKIVKLCAEAGVTLTGAGATFPYGVDPEDKNIRLAPTYPSMEDLAKAVELFIICVKLKKDNRRTKPRSEDFGAIFIQISEHSLFDKSQFPEIDAVLEIAVIDSSKHFIDLSPAHI